jgi:hypothetical protein
VTNQQLLESLIEQLQILPSGQNSDWFKGYVAGIDSSKQVIQNVLFTIQAQEYVRDNIVPPPPKAPTPPATRIIRENGEQPKAPVPPEMRYG